MNVTYRCEHDFWNGEITLGMDEPMAALSGLCMSVIALFGNAGLSDPPLQVCIARASLVLCGLGTFTYHAIGDKHMSDLHLNGIIFDGVSMALVTVNIFLLYLSKRMNEHKMAVSIAALMYLFFWIITNDLLTYTHLESITMVDGISLFAIAGQYPTFVIVYVYILIRVILRQNSQTSYWKMWLCLFISLLAWGVGTFACHRWDGVFIGHVIWHIGIGYVAHYLIILGAAETYGFVLSGGGFFLRLDRKAEEKQPDTKEGNKGPALTEMFRTDMFSPSLPVNISFHGKRQRYVCNIQAPMGHL